MNIQDLKTACEDHKEESMWYYFLNYGCPVDDEEYEAKYNAVRDALDIYCTFMNAQMEMHDPDDFTFGL